MKIIDMNPNNDHIIIQSAAVRKNYCEIRWLPNAIHRNIIVCLKSPYLSYDTFKDLLDNRYQADEKYENEFLYISQPVRGNSVEISMNKISRPFEIILLPVRDDSLFFPGNKDEFDKIKYMCRGLIKYEVKQEKRFKKNDLLIEFTCSNSYFGGNEIIAKYIIDKKVYPVTTKMLNKCLEIQIGKKCSYHMEISEELKDKYLLIEDEV